MPPSMYISVLFLFPTTPMQTLYYYYYNYYFYFITDLILLLRQMTEIRCPFLKSCPMVLSIEEIKMKNVVLIAVFLIV